MTAEGDWQGVANVGDSRAMATDMGAERVATLLARMTLAEKVGQVVQVNVGEGGLTAGLSSAIGDGRVGSVLNAVGAEVTNELQRLAVEQSRLGIPLLIGRDVIHGFRTIFPIPLGQASSWDPSLVREAARISAIEAASAGVNWTFAPMVDISRDPRWGRVAEGLGEDPHLASRLGAAMVLGFQDESLAAPDAIAACAKHFAGYGAVEGGRDYAATAIPERELRDVHLPPFRAAARAGAASFMTAFSDLNGVPASANAFLLHDVLRGEWGYDGLVVSDWRSIPELVVHGIARDEAEAARLASLAGVDMDMAGDAYADHLERLVRDGEVPIRRLDAMVTSVLRLKERLGLFDMPYTDPNSFPALACDAHLAAAHRCAVRSAVLLENDGILPLDPERLTRLAIIGPLADDGYEQLGTWVFDGDIALSQTPLAALRGSLPPQVEVEHVAALETTRSRDTSRFDRAAAAVAAAEVAVVFVGEEAILSGEAHSRADIGLPGAQESLLEALCSTGTPLVVVVMAGRPLALPPVVERANALLYFWHPGTMGGPAIADLLLGRASPSGKLPMTLPRVTGQIPIYYARRNTGRPAVPGRMTLIDDIPRRAPQHSGGNTSFHLDAGDSPRYPFGHGLQYTQFEYAGIRAEPSRPWMAETVTITAELRNVGARAGEEVVQLYVRDVVASVTRPVRELKGFKRVALQPGERCTVRFSLTAADLAFHDQSLRPVAEAGEFHAWIGGSAAADLRTEFEFVDR